MYTFEQAVEKWIEKLPWGLKALYQQNIYRNEHPFYCCQCGWYYPHDNWRGVCPVCKNFDIVQQDNSAPQFGLFGELF